jgi:hypothetical protein
VFEFPLPNHPEKKKNDPEIQAITDFYGFFAQPIF